MFIRELSLKNFRNFSNLHISFKKRIVFFVGNNAEGKTNLLEAIYFLSHIRSFRTFYEEELIKFGEKFAELEISLEKENIRIYLEKGNKTVFLNKKPVRKIKEIAGRFNVVLFQKQDTSIILGEREKRREFLDREIPQFIPSYYFYIHQYENILSQRNHLLKNIKDVESDILTIYSWDEQISLTGIEVIKRRKEFINKLNPFFSEYYKLISNTEKASLIYLPSIAEEEVEKYLKILRENLQEDLKSGFTQFGPHRDELKFEVNKRDLRKFSSAGEVRCAALALRLGILQLLKYEKVNSPILLLDDVFSELDSFRKNFLKQVIEKNIESQIFITTTSFEDLKLFPEAEIFKIENGVFSSLT